MPSIIAGSQALHRTVARVRYRLIQQRRETQDSTITVNGMAMLVAAGVFNPAVHISGAAIAPAIDARWIPPNSSVLDLATGCGVLAIFAARFAAHVTATDLSPVAVSCARANVAQHGLQNTIDVGQANLLDGLGRFDVILCNPPYEIDPAAQAEEGSFASADFFARLASSLGDHLTPTGHLLLALPSAVTQPVTILRADALQCEPFQTIHTKVADLAVWKVTARRVNLS